MKPDKTRGRGRGRGGRGGRTGRGRSGGTKTKIDKSGQSPDDTWWKKFWESEWGEDGEEWGTEGWGETGYYWDGYAWLDGQESLHKIETTDTSNASDSSKARASTKEIAEADHNTSKKKKKTDTTTETPASNPSHKKRKQKEDPQQDKEALDVPKRKQRRTPAAAEEEPEPTKSEDIKALKKFHKLYKDYEDTEASKEMRQEIMSKIKRDEMVECRLNVYWHVPSCGVTYKKDKKDIAYFGYNWIEGISYMHSLALALKSAELFVTWVHGRFTSDANLFVAKTVLRV